METSGSPPRVLVVDDDLYQRHSTAEILRLSGFEVDEAPNGFEAVKALQSKHYEAMLLDLKMPGMSGEEVLRRLPEIAPEVEVVLLTAHGSLDSAILALRQGAVDYLRKPATAGQIVDAVSRAVSKYRERRRKEELLGALERSIRELKGDRSSGEGEQPFVLREEGATTPKIQVDWDRRIVRFGDAEVYLTPAESRLFRVLWEAQGKVVPHGKLVRLVQGYEAEAWEAPEITRPLVSRLRAKLAKLPGGDKWIVNVRGTGYVLDTSAIGNASSE